MAEKQATKKRTYNRAIVRQEGESDVAFLKRKLEHAQQLEKQAGLKRVARLEKRIIYKGDQMAQLADDLSTLEDELAKLKTELGLEPGWTSEPAEEV